MATTPIKFLDLPAGLTATTKLVSLATGSVLETVSLTESGEAYNGNVTGAHAGQILFKVFVGTGLLGTRIRTIRDTTATFLILTELESLSNDGRGAYPVTITVTDGTDPVEGVLVRITADGLDASQVTNADGEAFFQLNNGDYAVTLSATGYNSSGESLTVLGATAPADYVITVDSITATTTPNTATGVGVAYDEDMEQEADVPISVQWVSGPGTAGAFYDTKVRTFYSDVDGEVQITGLAWGSTYRIWRGAPASATSVFAVQNTGSSQTFVVPSLSSFSLPEISGIDEEPEASA